MIFGDGAALGGVLVGRWIDPSGRWNTLRPVERHAALLAGYRDGRLISRDSSFQLTVTRQSRRKGWAVALLVHEDVLVFRKLKSDRCGVCRARSSASISASATPTLNRSSGPAPGKPVGDAATQSP